MEGKRALPIEEWAGRVAAMAAELFETTDKRVKVSPELDAPQFCQDWINAQPDEVRHAVIMVRGPKVDKNGGSDSQWKSRNDLVGVGRIKSSRLTFLRVMYART